MTLYLEYNGTPADGDTVEWSASANAWVPVAPSGGPGGATDHGALTGLADDDHTQYHNDARGDARYSPLGHTHSTGDITGFSEAIDDRVAALLVAGANITLTYNDGANTLTIAASSSGGGNEQLVWLGI